MKFKQAQPVLARQDFEVCVGADAWLCSACRYHWWQHLGHCMRRSQNCSGFRPVREVGKVRVRAADARGSRAESDSRCAKVLEWCRDAAPRRSSGRRKAPATSSRLSWITLGRRAAPQARRSNRRSRCRSRLTAPMLDAGGRAARRCRSPGRARRAGRHELGYQLHVFAVAIVRARRGVERSGRLNFYRQDAQDRQGRQEEKGPFFAFPWRPLRTWRPWGEIASHGHPLPIS